MGYENGAYNAQAHGLSTGVRIYVWAFVLAAVVLAMTLALAAPLGMAYADDRSSGASGAAANNSDASLTPTDSGGLKTQDESADEPKSDEPQPEPAVLISVSIISRDGRVLQTFQVEKGKTISFVDDQGEVLIQYVAEDPSITEPVAPAKSGYDFTGWSVKINDEGNAVITPQYQEVTPPAPTPTTDDVKTVRSANGAVTTNSPKTGDLLSLVAPLAIAGVALIAIMMLLFTRRRN